MIRITILSHSLEETLMHIAGWITTGEDVELVAQEGRRCLAQSRQLVLDLSEAHALDEEGVALLQGWQAQGRLQISKHNYRIDSSLRNSGLISSQEGRP